MYWIWNKTQSILKVISSSIIVLSIASIEADEFHLTEPVVCRSIKGFRDYEVLEPRELTTYDKLLIYLEPSGFSLKNKEEKLFIDLRQGAILHAKGSKKRIFEKEELFQYNPEVDSPYQQIYLAATIGFKNLIPGEYVLELWTVDKLAKPEKKEIQIIEFRIIPPVK